MKPLDLINRRFGRLVPFLRTVNNKHGQTQFICTCDCGNAKIIASRDLISGKTVSCGCFHDESARMVNVTHGESRTRLYLVWKEMRARCQRPSHSRYPDYGGRGIKVCDRWQSFSAFKVDMGPRPIGMTIDRVDNNGNYDPSNCRWATYSQQNFNKRKNGLVNV